MKTKHIITSFVFGALAVISYAGSPKPNYSIQTPSRPSLTAPTPTIPQPPPLPQVYGKGNRYGGTVGVQVPTRNGGSVYGGATVTSDGKVLGGHAGVVIPTK